MKIQIVSDLHLEFLAPGSYKLPTPDRDLLIIAGDLHIGKLGLDFFTKQAQISPVIYILGNHEYYNRDYRTILDFFNNLKFPNLYVLNNSSVVFEDVRFLGTTLWTDINYEDKNDLINARAGLNDFQVISYENRVFLPSDSIELYKQSKKWLNRELKKSFSGKTVVITHHLPTYRSIHPKYKDDELNPVFAAHCDDLIKEYRPELWIHGHTHESCDYDFGSTRILCNPMGGREINRRFNPSLVVDV